MIRIIEQLVSFSGSVAVQSKLHTIEFSPQNNSDISTLLMWKLKRRSNAPFKAIHYEVC